MVIQPAPGAGRPTIRLTYPLRRPADAATWASLVFDSNDVTLRGLRVVVDAKGSETTMAGVLFRPGAHARVENCEFVQAEPPPTRSAPA